MASQGKRMVPEALIKKLQDFSNNGLAALTAGNITTLTTNQINSLKCGDIVCKEDSTGKHAYIVSYKKDGTGICLTYADASVVETVSYDYSGSAWVYNSTDITPIAAPLMENIVDSAGNKRFIEGEGDVGEITGITSVYCKWSLSGSHLMLVYVADVADTTVIATATNLATFTLPKFIYDKIFTILSSNAVSQKQDSVWSSSMTAQTITTKLLKSTDYQVKIGTVGSITFTAERNIRIQYDLLIDAE